MKIKRITVSVLFVLLIIGIFPTGTFETKAITTSGIYENLKYHLYDYKEIQIRECMSDAEEIIIPNKINGHPVTSIGNNAFRDCTHIKRIVIPDSVTIIGYGAFGGCTKLTSITIGSGVKTISRSFYGCDNLERVDITNIASWCNIEFSSSFDDSNPLSKAKHLYLNGVEVTDLIIPEDVSIISDIAFLNCESIVGLTLHDNIEIGQNSFSGCSIKKLNFLEGTKTIDSGMVLCKDVLTEINIPNTVMTIESDALSNCTSLESIVVGANNPIYHSSGNCLIETNSKTLILGCKNSVIPIDCSITSIGDYAFYNCTGLTSVIIPDSVTSIGRYAFKSCTGLRSITIGNSVKSIGFNAFNGCTGLTSVIIPDSVTSIGDSAFGGCSSLQEITLPFIGCERYTSTDNKFQYPFGRIFGESKYLGGIKTEQYRYHRNSPSPIFDTYYIPASLKKVTVTGCDYIQYGAFYNCTRLKSITIGNSVKSIGNSAFYDCNYLSTITIPKRVTSIGYNAFGNCLKLKKVCYTGYKSDKAKINIDSSNGCLTNAKWHYLICKNDDHVFSENGNSTCSICGYSKVPSKPILESKTNNSVTLVSTRGFEYSKDGINWQISNTFENLTADKTHTFYQRVKETETVLESEESEALSVKLKKMQSSPSAPLVLSFTDTTVSLLFMDGCEYSIDGINWQASNVFTNLNPGTKYSFYQRYAETDIYEASEQSPEKSITTDKAKQPLIPAAPTVETIGTNIITLNAVENCEYSKDGINWQASHIFDGLSCGTEYSFYQRYKETDTAYAGQSSDACKKKTMKGTQTIPDAPMLLRRTDRSVELTQVSGYEYSKDGMNWQASNVFVGLSPETNYIFYQRKAETATYFASEASASLIVKTLETAFLNSISVTSYPNKLIYIKGEEVIDVTGGKLTLYYSDNTSLIISLTEDMVSGFNKDLVGNQEITVSYSGKTTVFIITVKDKAEKYKPSTPSVPTLISKTANSVTLKGTSGYEYSTDGKVWQNSNVFTGLNEDTEYTFYQRIAETKTAYASESSAALKVRTDKSYTPGDLDGDEKITDKDAIYLLMHSYFPEDYPVNQPLDYNNDGLINDKDAIYLLMHCYFPEDYPITK